MELFIALLGLCFVVPISVFLPVSASRDITKGNFQGLYFGCYSDNAKFRDLSYKISSFPVSRNDCANLCSTKKYIYAGLQAGGQCWCGNNFGKYNQLKATDCNVSCVKEPNIACGGNLTNSIYLSGYNTKRFVSYKKEYYVKTMQTNNTLD